MSKLLIVLFREFLEISLIINIISECTGSIKGSRLYISTGLFIGAISSLLFSYFIENISKSFNQYGEEIVNVIILILTSIAILYTVIWIKINQMQIKDKSFDAVNKISNLNYSKFTISFIVASSVLREFIEIALLSYGIMASSELKTSEYLIILILGGGGGLIFGLLIYKTLKSVIKKYLFKAFSVMLILISASMASEAAKILISSGIITTLNEPIWNIENVISDKNIIAQILKLLSIGYSSSPSIIETIFYFLPILGFFIFSKKVKGK
jgi:high-affinity iron transporter